MRTKGTTLRSGKLKNTPHCPACKTGLDGWTEVEPGESPRVDDVTVCVYCSSVLQYTEGFGLKLAPAEVIAEVTLPLSRAQNALRKMKADGGAKKS